MTRLTGTKIFNGVAIVDGGGSEDGCKGQLGIDIDAERDPGTSAESAGLAGSALGAFYRSRRLEALHLLFRAGFY